MAPTSSAKTDEQLGVGVLQRDYFQNLPVYLDKEQKMISALGKKVSIGTLCCICCLFPDMLKRQKGKNIKAGMFYHGEGSVQGGLLVLGPGGISPTFQLEKLGVSMDYEKLVADVQALSSRF
mmetsp:Transcript_26305/g.66406  ORF Transcript_26305/g.66406 Transcript_26305/m.66406 type:complete len:122 (+) Transcript_26305:290-655(+)